MADVIGMGTQGDLVGSKPIIRPLGIWCHKDRMFPYQW